MTSGCFDHSAIWSRTKICRRKCSSVAWASEIRSGRVSAVGIRGCPFAAVENGRQGIKLGDADQVVDRDPLIDGMLSPGEGSVRDRRDAGQSPCAVAVVDERLGADR